MQERCTSKRRIATMNADSDGDPLGVAIFLTPLQLTQLGVDPEAAEIIEYYVENEEILLRSCSECDEVQQ